MDAFRVQTSENNKIIYTVYIYITIIYMTPVQQLTPYEAESFVCNTSAKKNSIFPCILIQIKTEDFNKTKPILIKNLKWIVHLKM